MQVAGGTLPVDDLVTLARQTSARITFIEDPELLADVGGVGALRRFRIEGPAKARSRETLPFLRSHHMSSKNNVNPDHYKLAGRDRQGEDIVQSVQKQQFAESEARRKRSQGDASNSGPSNPSAGRGNADAEDNGTSSDEAGESSRRSRNAGRQDME